MWIMEVHLTKTNYCNNQFTNVSMIFKNSEFSEEVVSRRLGPMLKNITT